MLNDFKHDLVGVDHDLARIFEIDRDAVADHGLYLAGAPIRTAGMANPEAGK